MIIPDVLAFWFAKDVPFPALARTVADLERRWRPATMVIVAGLVVLMFHLAFAQWPDTFGMRGSRDVRQAGVRDTAASSLAWLRACAVVSVSVWRLFRLCLVACGFLRGLGVAGWSPWR